MNVVSVSMLAITALFAIGATAVSVSTSFSDSASAADKRIQQKLDVAAAVTQLKTSAQPNAAGFPRLYPPRAPADGSYVVCAWDIGPGATGKDSGGVSRWTVGTAAPTARTLLAAVISPGPDGVLQTSCSLLPARAEGGLALASGDDLVSALALGRVKPKGWSDPSISVSDGAGWEVQAVAGQVPYLSQYASGDTNATGRQGIDFAVPCERLAQRISKDATGTATVNVPFAYIPQSTLKDGKVVPAFCVQRLPYQVPAGSTQTGGAYFIDATKYAGECESQGLTLLTNDQWMSIANQALANYENWTRSDIPAYPSTFVTGPTGTPVPSASIPSLTWLNTARSISDDDSSWAYVNGQGYGAENCGSYYGQTNPVTPAYDATAHTMCKTSRVIYVDWSTKWGIFDMAGLWHLTAGSVPTTGGLPTNFYPPLVNGTDYSSMVTSSTATGGTQNFGLALHGGTGLFSVRLLPDPTTARVAFRCVHAPKG
ncbi:hypothetical protein [Ramlibacter alkalitolerans]|uniref:Sulfatase-modifying factor enzyme domain-containing protein n=1 Tax=Ramlibacter alkalitolerans TaxID=2039631 RepID=A0ABS1JU60_9BURK|nr:hypothetical protein [Ramlibacter alkalitolerans]MBL0427762.1 hypothetical protein [Ramlibacter alkalitolerans]